MMSYKTFGKILLSSGDLDPIYIMLVGANLESRILKRWLLAYWCYYSAGPCSKIAESKDFWATMYQAYNDDWPRGTERRHFRGEAAVKALDYMWNWVEGGPPEAIVDYMRAPRDFQSIARRVQEFEGFGPWISWKIADMVDRVIHWPIDFSNSTLGIYKDPVKGAALVRFGDQEHPITSWEVDEVVDTMTQDFHGYMAPPFSDRPVNVQEVETVLCKYKSYVNGHYPLGKDTLEVYHGLKGWGPLAEKLMGHLPKIPLTWRQ